MNSFSIILPVYNGGELVKQCVNSILNQTYSDFNLLVLDNNSDDQTLQWIRNLNDKRILIFPSAVKLTMEQNWGRITGISKNKFITLIGHDDVLHPHYLEEMNRLIIKHPDASLYQAHFSYIGEKGNFIRHCMPMDEIQYGHEFLACQLAQTMESMGTGYMMRSTDYDQLGGIPRDYPNLIFADYELWVKLTLKSYKATTDKICFNYRLHNSVSKQTNGEKYQAAFKQYIYFMADLAKSNNKVKGVLEKYGHGMLMYFCESLSHRLLKTPMHDRKQKVSDFIKLCHTYANVLIPGQSFEPEKKFRISIAAKIDRSLLGRSIFTMYKKIVT